MENREIIDTCLIFKCIVGSVSHGTYIERISDIDYKGVYRQSNNDILTFGYKEQIDINENETYYEVRRFLELLQNNDGNALSMLYSTDNLILYMHPAFTILRDNKEMFLTKECLKSFGGYAVHQIRRAKGLNKKMNWEKKRIERKRPIDFVYIYRDGVSEKIEKWLKENNFKQEYCGLTKIDNMRDNYTIYYDAESDLANKPSRFRGIDTDKSNSVRLTGVPKDSRPLGCVSFNKDEYSKHCRDYNEYCKWLSNRNKHRYIEVEGHDQKIDGKNILHCRRLLDIAKEIAVEKMLRVTRPNAEYLISIRQGKVKLEEIIEEAERDIKELPALYEKSGLPDRVSDEILKNLLLKIRNFK